MSKEITTFSKTEVSSFAKLQAYDFAEFNGQKNQAIDAQFISQKFQFLRFKSARYDKCLFEDCTFQSVGLSGTHFLSCDLDNFEISDTNMQFCDFSRNCTLQGTEHDSSICNSNLSQSMFCDSQITNVHFKSTTISQARFNNVAFQNVTWDSCTLQDNIFDRVTFDHISLIGCNLEYSEFKNINLKNIKLPFHQIPYTFGLLNYLKQCPDDILIGSASSKKKPIKPQEYMDLLPDLFSYYKKMNEYFPAINIALFLEDYDNAETLIKAGLCCYICSNDFRKIKAICKLIAYHPYYDIHAMTKLYFDIVEYYNTINVSEYEKYQYSLHINDIKKILTAFDNGMPAAQLYLKTNITSADTEKLGVFYQLIEQCLGDYKISNEEYSVEIRHNSDPLSFWLTITNQEPQTIIQAAAIIIAVITANPTFLKTALDVIAQIATIGSFVAQISEFNKSKKKTATSECSDVTDEDVKYVQKKNEILENQEISIQISLPFFNFSYRKEKLHESQN